MSTKTELAEAAVVERTLNAAEACYLGWQESLNSLARLVEPEIPDQP